MPRWLRIVLFSIGGFAALVVLSVLALYLAQPTSYRIARTRTIAAPAAAVRAHLVDLRAFEAWTPWEPSPGVVPTTTFSSTTSGVGAWVDRRDAYGGSRTTITAIDDSHVEMANATHGALGEGHSTQTFTLREHDGQTEVEWALGSDLSGLPRLLWPFVHLEATAGARMDAALGRLDAAVVH